MQSVEYKKEKIRDYKRDNEKLSKDKADSLIRNGQLSRWADYWKSQGHYWCKYCRIFVTDNKISRQHHESGRRHRGNVERFLRDIHHRNKQETEEAARIKKELEKIEKAALNQYAQDIAQRASAAASSGTLNITTSTRQTSVTSTTTSQLKRSRPSSPPRPPPPPPRYARQVVDAEAAMLPAPLPEGAEIGAPGPWMPVTPASTTSRERRLARPKGERGEAIIGSSAANDAIEDVAEDDEAEEKGILINGKLTKDPEDLRQFSVTTKSYPTDTAQADSDHEASNTTEAPIFKKRKTSDRSRNIRRK